MHWKQAQQSLRLHRIRLLINLVEGAHPPPQLPHRTASYIQTVFSWREIWNLGTVAFSFLFGK